MGYEGGNVPKEMADCAMADILSTIIRRAAFVFVVSNERTRKNLCFLFFWRLLVKKSFGRENFSERETNKERSQRDFELTFINPHNNNIIIREHEC